MFGYATSGCEALDAEMERAGGLFERDRAAPELDRLVGACLRRPAYKLATGRDYTMRRYVLAALSQMTSLALAYKETATFRALFAHYARLRRAWDRVDVVTAFVRLYLDERAHEWVRADGSVVAVVPRYDDEYAAAQLAHVFLRTRGADANDPTNQLHGGARTPLIEAIIAQAAPLVRVLLAHGADASVASYNHGLPLAWAARRDSDEILDAIAAAPGSRVAHRLCYMRGDTPEHATAKYVMSLGDDNFGCVTPARQERLRAALVRHGVCAP